MSSLHRSTFLILLGGLVALQGCGKDAQNNTTSNSLAADMSTDMTPASEDMAADMSVDMSAGEDMSADMSAPDMRVLGPACETPSACGSEEVCLQGHCAPSRACSQPRSVKGCQSYFTALGADAMELERTFCDGELCRLGCVRDRECAQGETCTDNGLCVEFTGDLSGMPPGAGVHAPLKAGVGNALMTFPIGLPLGGYGTRGGNDGERYSDALRASWGQMHGLYARAVLLDNGARQLLFIRMPIIFPTASLHEAVARQLQARTGRDWRDSLVISGTHTHSGPGRFLHLPPSNQASLPLGAFGTDWFNEEAFGWVTESAMDAADMALADLSDAQFGWEIVESFDNDDAISSDRWGATPPFDDNRLLLMRVDDLEGNPRALMFSFGMHGTINDSDYATGDSMGGIERKLEERFGQEYDRFVPTMFFNENGGTMSPRGDRFGHKDHQKMEWLGETFVDRMWEEVEGVQTDREVTLQGKTLRFPLGYEELGYGSGEWVSYFPDAGLDLIYGGLQCAVGNEEDNDPLTYMSPEDNTCITIAGVLYNRPPSLFMRSQMTALDIDGLTVVTLPGEASMELGWQVLRDIQTEHGVDPLKSWVWGYAQDHQFYLTPTNLRGPLPPFPGISTPKAPDEYPDFTFSYYQGGYEAGFTIWGANMGDFLAKRAVEVTGIMLGSVTQTEFEEPYPLQYSPREEAPFEVFSTDVARIGTITTQPPASVERLTGMEFSWLGGDPGAEMPQAPYVRLEREGTGGWEPVMHTNTREYSNREPLMLSRLRRLEGTQEWEWVIYWEELMDFPQGTYRFHVEGHYLTEAGVRSPYTTLSDSFALTASDDVLVSIERADAVVSGTLSYPGAESIFNPRTRDDPARVAGSYRLRNALTPTETPSALGDLDTITVRVEDEAGTLIEELSGAQVSITTTMETVDGRANIPVTRFEVTLSQIPSAPVVVKVQVTDVHENSGEAVSTL